MPLFEHAKIMMVYYTLIVSTYIFGPKNEIRTCVLRVRLTWERCTGDTDHFRRKEA